MHQTTGIKFAIYPNPNVVHSTTVVSECIVDATMDEVIEDATMDGIHRSPTLASEAASLPPVPNLSVQNSVVSISDDSALIFNAQNDGARNLSSKRDQHF